MFINIFVDVRYHIITVLFLYVSYRYIILYGDGDVILLDWCLKMPIIRTTIVGTHELQTIHYLYLVCNNCSVLII